MSHELFCFNIAIFLLLKNQMKLLPDIPFQRTINGKNNFLAVPLKIKLLFKKILSIVILFHNHQSILYFQIQISPKKIFYSDYILVLKWQSSVFTNQYKTKNSKWEYTLHLT